MKATRTFLTISLLVSLFMFGCNQKKDDSSTGVNDARARGGAPLNAQGIPTSGGYDKNAYGNVTVASSQKDMFNLALQTLISASMDPNEMGVVETQGGVYLRVYVETNGSQVTPGSSKMSLEIYDSYARQSNGSVPPIVIALPATQGTVNGNNFDITFGDQYGWIKLAGTYNNSTVTGAVTFQNNQVNAQGKSAGTIGGFSMATCGFFRCQ